MYYFSSLVPTFRRPSAVLARSSRMWIWLTAQIFSILTRLVPYWDLSPSPLATGDQTFSFLGVSFDAGERVSRVRITSGNSILGPNESLPNFDLVVLDDFIYAEPQATPLPGTFLLLGTGLAGFWLRRRFLKK